MAQAKRCARSTSRSGSDRITDGSARTAAHQSADAFAVSYLAAPLAAFKSRHRLTIEAVLTDRKVDLLAEGFDVAVRLVIFRMAR